MSEYQYPKGSGLPLFNVGGQGWICPKCTRVYSPTTTMCFYCGQPTTAASNSTQFVQPKGNTNER